MIYAFCLKAGLTEVEAEEVIQETMISVANKMPEFTYDRTKGSFKAWLLTIVRRRMVDRHRQESRWKRIVAQSTSTEAPTGLETEAHNRSRSVRWGSVVGFGMGGASHPTGAATGPRAGVRKAVPDLRDARAP